MPTPHPGHHTEHMDQKCENNNLKWIKWSPTPQMEKDQSASKKLQADIPPL